MSLSLDHVVILVDELEAAIAHYSALGFTVQRGGTHADGATHNALVGFADGSYLELIAFLRRAPEHRWWRYALAGYQGFVDFALLPQDTGEVIRAAQARGLAYEGPTEGGRLRLDGQRLVWQTGTPPTVELPFLCGDVTPRALRVVEGDVRVHANGVTGVASLSVVAVSYTHLDVYKRQALRCRRLAKAVASSAPPGPSPPQTMGSQSAVLMVASSSAGPTCRAVR